MIVVVGRVRVVPPADAEDRMPAGEGPGGVVQPGPGRIVVARVFPLRAAVWGQPRFPAGGFDGLAELRIHRPVFAPDVGHGLGEGGRIRAGIRRRFVNGRA